MSTHANIDADNSRDAPAPAISEHDATAISQLQPDGMEVSQEQIRKCLRDSDSLKQEATAHFRDGEWEQALAKYSSALGILPKRVEKPKSDPFKGPATSTAEKSQTDPKENTHELDKADTPEPSEPEDKKVGGLGADVAAARSVLNANIGACHVKLEEYKEAAQACTEALRDNPKYVKALQRRVMCNEKIGTWSSLTTAEEDYNTLLNILPRDSPLITPTRRLLNALKPRLEEAKQKETGEMLDKLKGVGNRILGNFGLSTDNFKFEPNGQGGYSLNFTR